MTEPIHSFRAAFAEDTPDPILSAELQNLDLAIGGEYVVEMIVTVNGMKAEVLSSTWRMKGEMIVRDSVRQTRTEGTFRTVSGPTLTGGHNGNPALITAAWIQEGVFAVNVSGTYRWNGRIKSYDQPGSVTIHAPALVLPKSGLGSPDVDLSSDRMVFAFDTGTLRYTCDRITAGGTIGFLQLVKGQCFRGGIDDCSAGTAAVGKIAQTSGSQTPYLDDSANDGPLFFWKTKAESAGTLQTPLEESIVCAEYPRYNWYRAGRFPLLRYQDDPQEPLEFFTYVAYQAPGKTSYVVIRDLLSWNVVVMACVNPLVGTWQLSGSQRLGVSSWNSHPWRMPEWKDCWTGMRWKDA